MGKLIRLIARIPRGVVSKVGALVAGSGVVGHIAAQPLGSAFAIDPSVIEAIKGLTELVVQLGVVIGALGFGRRVGADPDYRLQPLKD